MFPEFTFYIYITEKAYAYYIYLEISVIWFWMPGELLLCLFIENDMKQEDEKTLEWIENRENDCNPFSSIGKIGESKNPSHSQDAEKGKWT